MIQDRFQLRIIEQVVNVQALPTSSRKRCRERILLSECESKQMTEHIVRTITSNNHQDRRTKKTIQGSSDHASLVQREGGVKETNQLAKHT